MQYNAGCRLYGQAWLGDFGLAEVYEHSSNTREVTIPPAGRMGYLAPEYVYSAVPTEKTYVYSFGVVVLEVATGRRPVDDDGTVVVDWVWDLREKGKKRPRMLKDQILYQRIREQQSSGVAFSYSLPSFFPMLILNRRLPQLVLCPPYSG